MQSSFSESDSIEGSQGFSVEYLVKKNIADLMALSIDEVSLEVPLNTVGISSIKMLSLIVRIEKTFDITFQDFMLENEDFFSMRLSGDGIVSAVKKIRS